jgi:hypothetical protein
MGFGTVYSRLYSMLSIAVVTNHCIYCRRAARALLYFTLSQHSRFLPTFVDFFRNGDGEANSHGISARWLGPRVNGQNTPPDRGQDHRHVNFEAPSVRNERDLVSCSGHVLAFIRLASYGRACQVSSLARKDVAPHLRMSTVRTYATRMAPRKRKL